MMTPSTMPTTISMMLYGCSTTAKPWNRLPISSIISRLLRPVLTLAKTRGTFRQYPAVFERPLGQRHQEPELEHEEREHRHADRDRRATISQL